MPDKLTTCTILFADICRSTSLYEQVGDTAALELISEVLQMAGEITAQFNGKVIGTKGDEVFCHFDSTVDALLAANQIHVGIQQHNQFTGHPLAMRIGINRGPVVESADNVWGDTVNTAARLANLAKANQSLITTDTVASIDEKFKDRIRSLGQLSLRGKAGMVGVCEYLTHAASEEITQASSIEQAPRRSFLLMVRFRSRQKRFNPLLVRYLLGRNVNCDQVIDHPSISREHAEILYRNGRFVMRDFSTNGSYIVQNNKTEQIRRTSIELAGIGKIYLGQTLNNHQFCLEFTCTG